MRRRPRGSGTIIARIVGMAGSAVVRSSYIGAEGVEAYSASPNFASGSSECRVPGGGHRPTEERIGAMARMRRRTICAGVLSAALAALAPARAETIAWPGDFLTRLEALA